MPLTASWGIINASNKTEELTAILKSRTELILHQDFLQM